MSWYLRFRDVGPARPRDALPRRPPRSPRARTRRRRRLPLIPGVLKLRVGVVSTVGNYREHNEDNFYVPGRKSVRHDAPPEASAEMETSTLDPTNLFLVADGMGGQQAGEQASLMAIQIIPRGLGRRLGPGESDEKAIQKAIREAVAEANHEILGLSATGSEFSNMGTTVVLALFRNDRVYVAGIGDSRAYRLRQGRLEQLTEDHSLADALGKAGTITAGRGAEPQVQECPVPLPREQGRPGRPRGGALPRRPPRGPIPDGQRRPDRGRRRRRAGRVLGTCPDPQHAARQLKELALANQSKDNVTCLVIHVVGADRDAESSAGLRP